MRLPRPSGPSDSLYIPLVHAHIDMAVVFELDALFG